jgi:hypothetical protein
MIKTVQLERQKKIVQSFIITGTAPKFLYVG